MREKAVSFGSGQQQTYHKHQPVQDMLKSPASTFPPQPPATSQQTQPGNAKAKRFQKYWEMAKKWQSNGGLAPWHVNPNSKGKAKGKQKSKQKKGKGKKKGKFQKS
jgi:hypothetical protein